MELLLFAIFIFTIPSNGSATQSHNLRKLQTQESISCLVVEIDEFPLNASNEDCDPKPDRRCIFEDDDDGSYFIEGIPDQLWNDQPKLGSATHMLTISAAGVRKEAPTVNGRGGVLRVAQNARYELTARDRIVRQARAAKDDDSSNFFRRKHCIERPGNATAEREVATIDSARRRSLVQLEGTSSVLVVRVIDQQGDAPTKSSSQLSSDIFYDRHNLVSRYKDCSGGKLKFVPAKGSNIVKGVAEVRIPHRVSGQNSYTVEDWAVAAARRKLGNLDKWTHVMFVLPASVRFNGAAAYAYINYYRSVYHDTHASNLQVIVHEIGHNLSHKHSGEGRAEYGDGTCMMGASMFEDDLPVMCFNGPKSWYFDWYNDRQTVINPRKSPFEGKLVGINDYLRGQIPRGSRQHHVIVRVGADLYLMYNRREGINAGVVEKPNLVTIVKQANPRASQSWMQGGIDAGEEWRSSNWKGSSYDLVVKVCQKVNGRPDYARILVYLDGLNNRSCNSRPIQTLPPTIAPTIPEAGEAEACLTIRFDWYPIEVGWSIVDFESGSVIKFADVLSYGWEYIRQTTKICFALKRSMQYTLTMNDFSGDGLCCAFGFGYYKLDVDGVTVASGGQYDQSESQAFLVPTYQVKTDITIRIKFDQYPDELGWMVVDTTNNNVIENVVPGRYRRDQYSLATIEETVSVEIGKPYRFTIIDIWGDGLCCSYGSGNYAVSAEGNVFAGGTSFGLIDNQQFTVEIDSVILS